MIDWLNRDGDVEVPSSDWWTGLPGTDWRNSEGEGMREVADRMLAMMGVVVYYRPDLSAVDYNGGWGRQPEKIYEEFLSWLTPLETERQDPIDGYIRRRCLIEALAARPPGTEWREIIRIARWLYRKAWKMEDTPDLDRRPTFGRRRLKGVSATA